MFAAVACAITANGGAGELPYASEERAATQAVAALGSRAEAVRIQAAETLTRMLGQGGAAAVAVTDLAERSLSRSQSESLRGLGGQEWAAALRDYEVSLERTLNRGAAAKAVPLDVKFGEETSGVSLNLDVSRWYRLAVPAKGRLATGSQLCPALWTVYAAESFRSVPERVPYIRDGMTTELFFATAGSYVVRIEPLGDCQFTQFATDWSPGVGFFGASSKSRPLTLDNAGTSTVTVAGGASAWFKVTLTGSERLVVETERLHPDVDTVLEVFRVGEDNPVLTDDDSGREDSAASVDLMQLPPAEYLLRAGDLSGTRATFDLTLRRSPILQVRPGPAQDAALRAGGDVVLRVAVKAGRRYRLETLNLAEDVDTTVTVFQRGIAEAITENDDIEDGKLSSMVEWASAVDSEYIIVIGGSGSDGGEGSFRYRLTDSSAPIGKCSGDNVSLPIAATEGTFTAAVLEPAGGRLVLVDFSAEWCGACRQLNPVLKRVVEENCDTVRLVTVDVDRETALARRFAVEGIPVVLLISEGRVVDQFTGARSDQQVRDFLRQYLTERAPQLITS